MAAQNAGIDARLFEYLSKSLRDTAFYNLLGIELTRLGPGESQLEVETSAKHSNPLGVIHGGLMTSLADAAMGNAIRSLGITAVTADISVAMIAAASFGERLVGKGKVVKAGQNLIFAEAGVWAGERLISRSKGTFLKIGDIKL